VDVSLRDSCGATCGDGWSAIMISDLDIIRYYKMVMATMVEAITVRCCMLSAKKEVSCWRERGRLWKGVKVRL